MVLLAIEARNLVHERIKRLPGFLSIGTDHKSNTLIIKVNNLYNKNSIERIIGNQQHGFYIKYIIEEGMKFL